MKFKAGDHVHGTAGHDHMFTGSELIDAVVLDVNRMTGEVLIQIVEHARYPREEGAILSEDEKNLELIEKKGDQSHDR